MHAHAFSDQSTADSEIIPEARSVLAGAPVEGPYAELEGVLKAVIHTPTDQVDSIAAALVRKASKVKHGLSVLLALRNVQLERKLRDAQRRIIELQWEVAQFRRCIPFRETEEY